MAQPVKVVVIGGIVMDLVFEVPKWPALKQAVQASSFTMQPGGKGLNQAIAAARLGAQVSIISAIGQDHLGDSLLARLEKEGIDHQFVERRPAADTDATCVIVWEGKPGFIGAKLASTTVDLQLIKKAQAYIKDSDVLLATGEVPPNAVEIAFEIARKSKAITILNPTPPEPLKQLKSSLLSLTDYLVPNEWEASVMADVRENSYIYTEILARILRREKANNVIITIGDVGCDALLGDEIKRFSSFQIEVVDTTGASDAFCTALAVALAEQKAVDEAITIACASGALSCTKLGAANSMPTRSALNDFLKRMGKSTGLE
jgi:ribokinase